jgi:predicted nucleotidyltransferase
MLSIANQLPENPAGDIAMALRIELSHEAIADFCRHWRIREFAIFGSALREDFRPDSDVDVLVTFEPGVHWGFHDQSEMTRELESLFGRKVDLVERRLVEQSRNYIRRKHILSHLEHIYVA